MNLGLRHLHVRKTFPRELEPFPSPSAWKRFLDRVMLVVGIIQPVALLPQVGAIYIDHTKAGVSLATWLLLTFFNTMWALYGFVHRDRPIAIANTLLTVLDLTIVFGVLYYH